MSESVSESQNENWACLPIISSENFSDFFFFLSEIPKIPCNKGIYFL
jgi:hypothetical protein